MIYCTQENKGQVEQAQSDKEAVKKDLGEAVSADELTKDQADRLLPLVDAEIVSFDSQHGTTEASLSPAATANSVELDFRNRIGET